jgi:hypothetical protein
MCQKQMVLAHRVGTPLPKQMVGAQYNARQDWPGSPAREQRWKRSLYCRANAIGTKRRLCNRSANRISSGRGSATPTFALQHRPCFTLMITRTLFGSRQIAGKKPALVLGEGMFFIFPEYLVWPSLSLLIQKLRREEHGQTFLEVNHNSCGQPF